MVGTGEVDHREKETGESKVKMDSLREPLITSVTCEDLLGGSPGAAKKPVGLLYVKVVQAKRLKNVNKMLGASHPYVKLNLSGERLQSAKTLTKMNTLEPVWNEEYMFIVDDPLSQVLHLAVRSWEQIGADDNLGMQALPLRELTPRHSHVWKLDLLRGNMIVETTLIFQDRIESGGLISVTANERIEFGGLLSITIRGANYVEGKYHRNPYAVIQFRGEYKKTKMNMNTRNPRWNEDFHFLLRTAPSSGEILHIKVMTKSKGFSFRGKESLGYVDIDLSDVVFDRRWINEEYDLIKSQNGTINVDISWLV